MGEFYTVLALVNMIYLCKGIFYAWQIYLAPSPHGWTWISVAVGTLILIGLITFNVFVFHHYEMLNPVWIMALPLWSLGVVGLPMALSQQWKKYVEDKNNQAMTNENVE